MFYIDIMEIDTIIIIIIYNILVANSAHNNPFSIFHLLPVYLHIEANELGHR